MSKAKVAPTGPARNPPKGPMPLRRAPSRFRSQWPASTSAALGGMTDRIDSVVIRLRGVAEGPRLR